MWYSTEPRTRKYGKGYGSLSFVRNVSDRCEKKFIGTATKTGLDAAKTAEATSELIGNKVADKLVKPKPISDAKSSDVEEIVLSPEKRQKIVMTNIKWNTRKYVNYKSLNLFQGFWQESGFK